MSAILPVTFTKTFDWPCRPAPRPRIMGGHAVRDPEYQGWKERVALGWRFTHGENALLAGFEWYSVRIEIHGPRRGDLDNYAKSVLDALVGVAFPDDSVTHLRSLEVRYLGPGSSFLVAVSGV